jgi:hypothetical protein
MPPKEIETLVKLLESKQHFGFAGTRPAVARMFQRGNQPIGDALSEIFEGADSVQAGFSVGKDCDIVFRFAAKDERGAKQFFQTTTIALAALRGVVAKNAKENSDAVPFAEFVKELRTGREGNTVVWRSKMSFTSAAKLLKNFMK